MIRNNIISRNGSGRPWYYAAGNLVGHSANVEVYGNVLSGNRQAIAGIQQNRGSGAYGPHLLQNLYVHDNVITPGMGRSGVAQGIGNNAVFTSWNNRFERNTYHLGTNATPFTWMNRAQTPQNWQQYGLDTDGTFNR